ncbi:hypothetical protein SDC9_79636 [bioreactor metagenome]|uniref:Uncharacterized protein n=1 Tax=bioreactor metagenome TaxID=1076179 RepID=A0A644YXN5_9ZZZZ
MIKQFVRLETDTVTETPLKIPFDFINRDSLPAGKDPGDCIVVSPITVRTWFKLKPLLLSIDKSDFDKVIAKEDPLPDEELTEIISKYDNLLIDIICIGIHNKKSDPPAWFKEVLKDNCTWMDIYILLNAILFRIGYNPFCKSITTVQSVSPMTEAEIIAAQKNAESWKINQLAL